MLMFTFTALQDRAEADHPLSRTLLSEMTPFIIPIPA